jgi:hypothetical protein
MRRKEGRLTGRTRNAREREGERCVHEQSHNVEARGREKRLKIKVHLVEDVENE